MPTCQAKTKSGTPCKNSPIEGSDYCRIKSHQEQSPESGLTDKQKRFVEEYCIDYNATGAARRAGYSEKTASEIGFENLRKPKISEAVKKRMDELSMSAGEAVKRMTDWGRGDFRHFLHVDEKTQELRVDLSSDEARANLHLIKKIKQHDTIVEKGADGQPDTIRRTWEIELHDAKDAVDKIIRVHGLYVENVNMRVDRQEYDPENGDPEEFLSKRLSGK